MLHVRTCVSAASAIVSGLVSIIFPHSLQTFHSLSRIIQQCWVHESEARLSSLRVKKNLANLQATKTDKIEKS